MRYLISFIIISMCIISCGPSAEEKAGMEKATQDSIAAIEEAAQAASEAAKMDSMEAASKKGSKFKKEIVDTYCCSNHDPEHCGTKSDLKSLASRFGCTGFHN